MVKRPEILITAGITTPWASLSVQQCNHQPSACNAQVASAPHKGWEGEAEGEVRSDTEQMDNVSFDIVLRQMKTLRLTFSNQDFCLRIFWKQLQVLGYRCVYLVEYFQEKIVLLPPWKWILFILREQECQRRDLDCFFFRWKLSSVLAVD